jgi:ABC-type branched-subunit amino acid transport system ATPase component
MTDTVRLEKVNKRFGGVVVAANIDITLSAGEIMGLIGPNGAGKTSLFNLISGIVIPNSGIIYFQGKPINEFPVYQRARLGISRTWQNIRLFQSMSVIDNLLIGCREYRGESIWQTLFRSKDLKRYSEGLGKKALRLLDRVGLADQWNTQVSEIPYGQQKLVGLARALMNDGTCLLLDEPMAGVEADVYDTMKAVVREEAKAGRAICVIEHTISFVKDLCDSAVFMFNGQIIAKGSVDDLLKNKELTEIYFG